MPSHIISTGTITHAIKGRDLLRRSGYKAYIERRSSGIGSLGCGYNIKTSGDISRITDILRGAGIKILEIN